MRPCKFVVKKISRDEGKRKKFPFHPTIPTQHIFKGVALNFFPFLNLDIEKINNSRRREEKKTKKKERKKTRFKALFKFLKQIFLCCTMRVKWCWLNEWVLQFFLTFLCRGENFSLSRARPQRNLIVGEDFPLSANAHNGMFGKAVKILLSSQYTLKNHPRCKEEK